MSKIFFKNSQTSEFEEWVGLREGPDENGNNSSNSSNEAPAGGDQASGSGHPPTDSPWVGQERPHARDGRKGSSVTTHPHRSSPMKARDQ